MKSLLHIDLDYILEHTDSIWDELNNNTLLITGGTGFIGCWLLETFAWATKHLNLNLPITILTRDKQAFHRKVPHLTTHAFFNFIQGDVRHFTFPQENFSYIIHAATEANQQLDHENPQLMFDTIQQGTRHILQCCIASQTKKLLLVSSGAVYGKQPPHISHLEETFEINAALVNTLSAYGQGKHAAEALCLSHAHTATEIKIARCFTFVGPYLPLDKHFAIGNFIRDGLAQSPIHIKGDGRAYRSYQYAADLIISLLHILCHGVPRQAYNVGSDVAISILELARLVASCFQPSPPIYLAKMPNHAYPAERYVPSVKRLQQTFGLTMQTNLRDAILKTIDWHTQKNNFSGRNTS